MDIRGAVVLVTGASSGIGAATARLASQRGAKVVLAARRADRLDMIAGELPGALALTTDMRDPEQISTLIARTVEERGRLDVLINNAGQGLHVPLEQVKLADFEAVMMLNVFAPLLAMQAVLPTMRRQGGGAIVNISSGTSRRAIPGLGAYAATKSALNMLSEVARAELAPDGIVVSLVMPRITATDFHDTLRAGRLRSGADVGADTPERVAQEVLRAVETGVAEIAL